MKLLQYLHTKNLCYKAGKKMTPIGFVLHSTGANNPTLKRYVGSDDILGINKNNNDWNQETPGGRKVCVHGFIGKLADETIATCQTLPWDMCGWHVGGKGNDNYIGVEVCEDNLKDKNYFLAVWNEAVELVTMLQKKYGFPISNIIDHAEAYKRGLGSNHADISHWLKLYGKTMDDFRAEITRSTQPNAGNTSGQNTVSGKGEVYRVRTKWNSPDTQQGAFEVLENAKALADKLNNKIEYYVYDSKGNIVYPE